MQSDPWFQLGFFCFGLALGLRAADYLIQYLKELGVIDEDLD